MLASLAGASVLSVTAASLAAILLFNALVRARQMVGEGWSGVEVQLQRRADLIPALVATVQGHAAHERALFQDIADRRVAALGAASPAARGAAERAVTESLVRLVAVAEAYPALTADQSFLELQRNLAEVEDRLQDARRYYNATVRELNVKVESFPSALVARAFSFEAAPFFDAGEDAALRVPVVAAAADGRAP
jgi:LemA protein